MPLGTQVTIVRQPVKATMVNGRVLVEVHDESGSFLQQVAVNLLVKKGLLARVNLERLRAALGARSGMPTDITNN